ncbi:glycosyltransferase 87 family protein [Rhodococcus tibetensis]|uniref:Glycosyltransferase 87 family protein n=1 Tax=Rhodococcus tibetensis TaxID=2965064 RepID=A0ABT1QHX4_9NOCA|nr:glycosyltransferase 87 family protein [Rhodococcus sp. FXJ9.536]MCQ4121841.1 glycosyltransferase 87 family protein [Rhodococcus sp. FXJ9.536]
MAGSEAGGGVLFPRSLTLVIGLVVSATVAAALVLGPVDPWTPDIGLFAGGADLHVYRDGGWRVQHDLPLYGGPVVLGLHYTYTPFSALVFIPVERIPGAYVDNLWMALNLCVLAACILLCWRVLGYRITPYLLLVTALATINCTLVEPVRTTLFYGQINLVLMLLVLWDFSRPNRSLLRGVGTGIGAGIKLTPAYFVVVFLALRQWRAAAVATAAFLATVGVAWVVIPGDSRQYWTSTFFDSTRIADNRHPSNQSLRGTLARLTDGTAPLWLWFVVAGTVAAISLVVSVRLYQRGEHLLAVALSGLTMAVVSPYSWSHHWVWLIPLLVDVVHRALTVRRPWWWAAAALFAATAAWPYWWSPDFIVIGLFLYPPSWPVAPILQNIYLVVYVPVLVASAVFARRTRSPALVAAPPEAVDPMRRDPPHMPLRSA